MTNWTLKKGDTIARKKLHDLYGGGRQGGISPSRRSPNVIIFSDRAVGERHGYADRSQDGIFLYVGEGQQGDQQMTHGNKAILNHVEDGRSIRLFWGCRGVVTYAGEYELDHVDPWFNERAGSTDGGPQRNVIVFRLIPVKKE
jgi:hypothetical protein